MTGNHKFDDADYHYVLVQREMESGAYPVSEYSVPFGEAVCAAQCSSGWRQERGLKKRSAWGGPIHH